MQLPELPLVFPVTLPVKLPVTDVTVNTSVLGLYVNPVSVSIPWVPVAPSTNVIYVVSLVLLFALTVTLVASVAVAELPVQLPELPLVFPVTLPVKFPVKNVLVSYPLLGLYVNSFSVFTLWSIFSPYLLGNK